MLIIKRKVRLTCLLGFFLAMWHTPVQAQTTEQASNSNTAQPPLTILKRSYDYSVFCRDYSRLIVETQPNKEFQRISCLHDDGSEDVMIFACESGFDQVSHSTTYRQPNGTSVTVSCTPARRHRHHRRSNDRS